MIDVVSYAVMALLVFWVIFALAALGGVFAVRAICRLLGK